MFRSKDLGPLVYVVRNKTHDFIVNTMIIESETSCRKTGERTGRGHKGGERVGERSEETRRSGESRMFMSREGGRGVFGSFQTGDTALLESLRHSERWPLFLFIPSKSSSLVSFGVDEMSLGLRLVSSTGVRHQDFQTWVPSFCRPSQTSDNWFWSLPPLKVPLCSFPFLCSLAYHWSTH